MASIARTCYFLAFWSLTVLCSEVWAQSAEGDSKEKDEGQVYERMEVRQRTDDLVGLADAASDGATGSHDLAQRPVLRPGEVLETVPGVIVTQHSGDGKANQFFLRGFNLDHGTDFRITLDHMQINMPSHGHGQGYADLNLLIPELVDTVRFHKGPYHADVGDFGTAGASEIEYVNQLPAPIFKLTGGSHQFQRALLAHSWRFGNGSKWLTALEARGYDGPWQRPNRSKKFNGVLKWTRGNPARGSSLSFMAYDQAWNATDQVPLRALEENRIGRFDGLDPDLGGATRRLSLTYEGHRAGRERRHNWHAYLATYQLELYSNFTYFLQNPVDGDEFEQADKRAIGGLGYQVQWQNNWRGHYLESEFGFQGRFDQIDNGLYPSVGRRRTGITREDEILQSTTGIYVQNRARWNDRIRTVGGVRLDYYFADVADRLGLNSGTETDWIFSPKGSVILSLTRQFELYLNGGFGFHSNDARGTTIRVDPVSREPAEPVPALVRAKGAEIGMATNALRGLQASLSVFHLALDSELVFVGDAGGTEASRPSRRQGIEFANHYHPTPFLSLDLDMTFSRARFTDDHPAGDRIPGTVGRTIAAGVSYHGRKVSGSLRLRHLGDIPLIEDETVRGKDATLLNGRFGYTFGKKAHLSLDVFNLLNRENPDIQYFYVSRLPGEPTQGIGDIHLHPMESRTARLSLTWRY